MRAITYDGINGCVTLYFLFKLIYQNSTNTFVEKDDMQPIFYWSQFSEIFYAIGGIKAFHLSKLSLVEQTREIYIAYLNYVINIFFLALLQFQLPTEYQISFLQVLGFQNFTHTKNDYFQLPAIMCQYLFGQVVILLFAYFFQQFRKLYRVIIVSYIFFALRICFVAQILHDNVIYTQYLFTGQPLQELIAFFVAYHVCPWFEDFKYQRIKIIDIICSIMIIVQSQILKITERAGITVMQKSVFAIIMNFVIVRFLYISYIVILILFLGKSQIFKRILTIPFFSKYLGNHQISVFCAFIISQQVLQIRLQNIKIGPFDQSLIKIIVFGIVLYTVLLSYIYGLISDQIGQFCQKEVDKIFRLVIEFAEKTINRQNNYNQNQ